MMVDSQRSALWGTLENGERFQSDYSSEEGKDARAFIHRLPICHWLMLLWGHRLYRSCLSCAQAGHAPQVLAVTATSALEARTEAGGQGTAVPWAQSAWDSLSLCLLSGNNYKYSPFYSSRCPVLEDLYGQSWKEHWQTREPMLPASVLSSRRAVWRPSSG